MDVDASERRKIKIYAGKKKKCNEENFPSILCPIEMLWQRFKSREFLFANYVFVNNKYAWWGELTCQMNPTWKL